MCVNGQSELSVYSFHYYQRERHLEVLHYLGELHLQDEISHAVSGSCIKGFELHGLYITLTIADKTYRVRYKNNIYQLGEEIKITEKERK